MPSQSIPPSEQMRQRLEEFLAHGIREEGSPTSALLSLAARVVLQEALEAEQRDAVGRERYERGSDGRYRNGYRPGRVEGAEGAVHVQVPQVRGIGGYRSGLMEFLSHHSEVLEQLVAEMYARGLSTRDIEDAFTDAIYESLRRQGGPKEAVLCAWGICANGRRVLLHLALGNKERHGDWLDFLRGMVSRGLCVPLTMTSDGAPGLLRALQELFPRSLRIRCWRHKMQNILDKLPDAARAEAGRAAAPTAAGSDAHAYREPT